MTLTTSTGFRTDRLSHAEAAGFSGRPVQPLPPDDLRFHHLDTAPAVLDDEEIRYCPHAFSATSQAVLLLTSGGSAQCCTPESRELPGW